MISVVVYARNDAGTISRCLESLALQRGQPDFEVLVIDDCSEDQTARMVSEGFPQYGLVRNPRALGWVKSLRQHIPRLRGNVLASLGAHCRAHEDWLRAVGEETAKGPAVVTGMGYHGSRFMERFEAVSVHADYLAERERTVEFLWDDNFAIRAELLPTALPDTDLALSDGAGAFLLSRRLRAIGLSIAYRPSIKIHHATPCLRELFRTWYGEMAENAITMRRVDPSLPGAGLLFLGPVAAGMFAAGRLLQCARAMARARSPIGMSALELCFHVGLLACMMPGYFVGLCREIFLGARPGLDRSTLPLVV